MTIKSQLTLGYLETMKLLTFPTRDLMHIHCIGKSDYGKSRWLAAFFIQLLSCGVNATILDVAGDLSPLIMKELLKQGYFSLPSARERLIYLDLPEAARRKLYVPLNVLAMGYDPYTSASLVLEAFKRLWPSLDDGTATTIESLVKFGSFVLASNKMPLFPYLHTLITDSVFRERMLKDITNRQVKEFFTRNSSKRLPGQLDLSIEPTLKRIGLVTFAPVLYYSLGQSENSVLNFRNVFETRRSVIVNLHLGDPEAVRFWGSLLTVSAETAAQGRGEVSSDEIERKHVLIIDEFQNFVSQSGRALRTMLDQCRKNGVLLCLAHQSWSQVSEELEGALNNCDVKIAFRLERSDAEKSEAFLNFAYNPYMTKPRVGHPLHYTPPLYYSRNEQQGMNADKIGQLEQREAFIRLRSSDIYKMRSLKFDRPEVDELAWSEIQEYYLKRYFRPQAEIEQEINAQLPNSTLQSTSEQNNKTSETKSSEAAAPPPTKIENIPPSEEKPPGNNEPKSKPTDLPPVDDDTYDGFGDVKF